MQPDDVYATDADDTFRSNATNLDNSTIDGVGGNDTLEIYNMDADATPASVTNVNNVEISGRDNKALNADFIEDAEAYWSVGSREDLTVENVNNLATVGMKDDHEDKTYTVEFDKAVTDAEDAVDVSLVSVGIRDTNGAELVIDGFETYNVTNTGESTLNDIGDDGGTEEVTTLNIDGDGELTLNEMEDSVGTVDAAEFTGDLDVTYGAADATDGVSFTGGEGNDAVDLDAVVYENENEDSVEVDMGAGDDEAYLGDITALDDDFDGTYSVDAGEGTDEVSAIVDANFADFLDATGVSFSNVNNLGLILDGDVELDAEQIGGIETVQLAPETAGNNFTMTNALGIGVEVYTDAAGNDVGDITVEDIDGTEFGMDLVANADDNEVATAGDLDAKEVESITVNSTYEVEEEEHDDWDAKESQNVIGAIESTGTDAYLQSVTLTGDVGIETGAITFDGEDEDSATLTSDAAGDTTIDGNIDADDGEILDLTINADGEADTDFEVTGQMLVDAVTDVTLAGAQDVSFTGGSVLDENKLADLETFNAGDLSGEADFGDLTDGDAETFADGFEFTGAEGGTTVTLRADNVQADGEATFNFGDGEDIVSLGDELDTGDNTLSIDLGGGDDELTLTTADIKTDGNDTFNIDGGAGTDTVIFEGGDQTIDSFAGFEEIVLDTGGADVITLGVANTEAYADEVSVTALDDQDFVINYGGEDADFSNWSFTGWDDTLGTNDFTINADDNGGDITFADQATTFNAGTEDNDITAGDGDDIFSYTDEAQFGDEIGGADWGGTDKYLLDVDTTAALFQDAADGTAGAANKLYTVKIGASSTDVVTAAGAANTFGNAVALNTLNAYSNMSSFVSALNAFTSGSSFSATANTTAMAFAKITGGDDDLFVALQVTATTKGTTVNINAVSSGDVQTIGVLSDAGLVNGDIMVV